MMKKTMMAFAALAAFQAGAITATKEYVDRRDTEIRTNTYTKAETDARIVELAPLGITTNDVCNIVTNETDGTFGEWTSSDEDGYPAYYLVWTGSEEDDPEGFWFFDNYPFERNLGGNYYSTELTMEVDEEQIVKFTRIYTPGRNALGLARLTDIAPTISSTVTKAYVENLGIESGISADTATNIATSIATDMNDVLKYELISSEIKVGSASYSDDAESAYSLKNGYDVRYANNIFAVLDESASTNYAQTAAENAVANADTTYRRFVSLTNVNQSVQYVETDDTVTDIAILAPATGETKDWIVYIYAATNATLTLPAGITWWTADAANTNAIEAAKPTAFYFSQIHTNIFYLGRQELTTIGGGAQ